MGMTFVWALELGRYGITVNGMAPAGATRMTMGLTEDAEPPPDQDPALNAPLVAFLASEAAADVNGQIFGRTGFGYTIFQTPRQVATMWQDGGWTPSQVAEHFHEVLGQHLQPVGMPAHPLLGTRSRRGDGTPMSPAAQLLPEQLHAMALAYRRPDRVHGARRLLADLRPLGRRRQPAGPGPARRRRRARGPGGHPPRAGQRAPVDRGLRRHPPGRGGGRAVQPAADPARGRAHGRPLPARRRSSPRSRSSTATPAGGRRWWWPCPPRRTPRTVADGPGRRPPAGGAVVRGHRQPTPDYFQVPRRAGRPGRHPLHLGHHRASQGGGRPPRQLLARPLRRAGLDRRGVDARQPALHLRRALLRVHADEAGHAGLYMPRFDAEQWLDAVERSDRWPVFLVPAMANLLLEPPALRHRRRSTRCRSAPSAAPRWPRSSWSGCRSGCPPRWSPTTTG